MDYRCPICGEDESTPGVKLMFSICSHQVCEKCLKNLFRNDTEVNCPICNTFLKRTNFSKKYSEDLEMEKDREVRLKVLSIYPSLGSKLSLEDFSSQSDYFDYLEKIEDLIEDILNQRNIDTIKDQMDKDRESRKAQIAKLESKKNELKKEFYERAIIADSLFNESLHEEASRILTNKPTEPEEPVIIKNMPQKIDDSVIAKQLADIEKMSQSLKSIFLDACGFDKHEVQLTSQSELLQGFR